MPPSTTISVKAEISPNGANAYSAFPFSFVFSTRLAAFIPGMFFIYLQIKNKLLAARILFRAASSSL